MKIRFFAAGEYSPAPKNRPHYHVILFGYPGCQFGQTNVRRIQELGKCCANCEKIRKTWKHGFVFGGSVNVATVEYTLDYTMKKLVGKMADLYEGRHPEFCRSSRRPGIGYMKVDDVAEGIRNMEKKGQFLPDVPVGLRFGDRIMPLNPLFRRKTREALGREPTAPKEAQIEHSQKLLDVQMVARTSTESLSQLVSKAFEGKRLKLEARLNIHKQRKKL